MSASDGDPVSRDRRRFTFSYAVIGLIAVAAVIVVGVTYSLAEH